MKRLFPNPFYALLLVMSTLFVLTTLAYLVVPLVLSADAGAAHLIGILDRDAPRALAIECVLMILLGLLAMTTDQWFGRRKP